MNQAFPKYALVAGTMCSLVKRVDPALPEDGGPVVVCSCAGEERYLTEARWLEMAADFRQHAGERGIVTSQSPAREKIALFRSLFSGRPDVHAHGFRKKDGGIGFAPACANEWRRGVCPRAANSKAKCSGCPCQAFDELSDQAIVRHFKGEDEGLRDVLGLYVLDADSNTSVLVMDFDEGDWKGAVAAVRAAGRAHGVEACVERSRSGNGGHMWFFFERAISAKLARDFGSALITEAMAAARSVSFDAYDRMFPAQSTIPEGGFGNLNAAPFQGRAQWCGNSVFVDENFEPYVDQWLFLSQVKRLGEQEVQAIAAVPGPTSPKTRNDAAPPWGAWGRRPACARRLPRLPRRDAGRHAVHSPPRAFPEGGGAHRALGGLRQPGVLQAAGRASRRVRRPSRRVPGRDARRLHRAAQGLQARAAGPAGRGRRALRFRRQTPDG